MSRSDIDPADDSAAPGIVQWQPTHHQARPKTFDSGALALAALGATAVGALAIGALAIGRLAVGRARIREMHIDQLTVGSIRLLRPR